MSYRNPFSFGLQQATSISNIQANHMKTKASNKDSHNIQASTPIASSLQCLQMYQMKFSLANSQKQSSDINNNNKITIRHKDKVSDESKRSKVLHYMKAQSKIAQSQNVGIGQVLQHRGSCLILSPKVQIKSNSPPNIFQGFSCYYMF